MEIYEKPIVLVTEDFAEGVYAASGAVTGNVSGTLIAADHYGNFYMKMSGFENSAIYRIVVTVTETDAVYGLSNASWGDYVGIVSGNTATFESVCLANQTDWHIRLWFDSQGNWESGWLLQDADIPNITVSVTKVA